MEKLKLPLEFIRHNKILPTDGGKVYITPETPFYAVEDIRFIYGKPPETVLITPEEFEERLEEYIANIQGDLTGEGEQQEEATLENLLEAGDSKVVQLLNSIILKAVKLDVSDIHFEPYRNKVVVRYRLDGVLHEETEIPKGVYPQVVSRIKVMAKLNVAEKRLPQDGRIRVKIGKKEVDLRVSTIPTVFGERVVVRLLDKTNRVLTIEELGLLKEDKERYERIIKKPYGLVLITGPTGSGKSTTLYATLLKLKSPMKNIITIEDPVEYQIEGIGQIQVNPKINLTFAQGLRSILRQDPDIIMVGEIRDRETAEISIHASMTGHLVLSTLHTNDAPSSVARLVDMGIQPYLVASSLEGVVAQRLVRKVCPYCKEEREITETQRKLIQDVYPEISQEFPLNKLSYGKGCEHCHHTGYKGRTAIYEIMEVDEDMKRLISKNVDTTTLRKEGIQRGMKTLIQDGIKKALMGITTLEEVLQVAQV
ncbi:MAG: type II/IV secretion system protein [Aquificae bacterium]|nr:type II/IV secretion system protein [Aquificota bacterium]